MRCRSKEAKWDSTTSRHSTSLTKELNEEFEKIPQLNKLGFKVSKSATNTRVVQRNANFYEGRRHGYCLPVRSSKAKFDSRGGHVSLRFCNTRNRIAKSLRGFHLKEYSSAQMTRV